MLATDCRVASASRLHPALKRYNAVRFYVANSKAVVVAYNRAKADLSPIDARNMAQALMNRELKKAADRVLSAAEIKLQFLALVSGLGGAALVAASKPKDRTATAVITGLAYLLGTNQINDEVEGAKSIKQQVALDETDCKKSHLSHADLTPSLRGDARGSKVAYREAERSLKALLAHPPLDILKR